MPVQLRETVRGALALDRLQLCAGCKEMPGSGVNDMEPQPTQRHPELLGEFLALPGLRGNLDPDAHLAVLSLEHGLTLCSTDGDVARFRRCVGLMRSVYAQEAKRYAGLRAS